MTSKSSFLSGRSAKCLRSIFSLLLLNVIGLTCFAPRLSAQVANYAGVLTTVDNGATTPTGVAVDGSGNVYISYPYDNGGSVVQIPWTLGTGYELPRIVANNLGSPFGLAVDENGNVFIAVTNTNSIMKAAPAGSGIWTLTTAISGLSSPKGVAIDGQGNLYIADAGSHTVIEYPWTGSGYGMPLTLADATTSGSADSPNFGVFTPYGVAVDGSGNVFVADYGNGSGTGTVLKIPAGCTVAGGNCPIQLDYGMHEPEDIAVDGSGDLFIADHNFGWILELPWTGGGFKGYSLVHPPLFNSGLRVADGSKYYPSGVAVDQQGNVYFSSTDTGTTSNSVKKGKIEAVDFGTVSVGSASVTIPISFVFVDSATVTLGSWSVLTHGTAGLDFSDASGGTCSSTGPSNSYVTNDGCTVDVTFTPLSSGLSTGAVVLKDMNGTVIATAYLRGVGIAPQAAFSPGYTIYGSDRIEFAFWADGGRGWQHICRRLRKQHRGEEQRRVVEHGGQRFEFALWCSSGWRRKCFYRRYRQQPNRRGAMDGQRLWHADACARRVEFAQERGGRRRRKPLRRGLRQSKRGEDTMDRQRLRGAIDASQRSNEWS